MGLECGDLAHQMFLVDGLVVVHLVGLEQEQGVGSVGSQSVVELLRMEERVTSGHQSLDDELSGRSVVGV